MNRYISSYHQVVGERATGELIEIEVIEVKGSNPIAPSAYIQASLHGAEVQGNAVIYFLLKELKRRQPIGNLKIVPHCNPLGGNLKIGEHTFGRFDPITGENWNRLYFFEKAKIAEFIAHLDDKLSLSEIFSQFRHCLLKHLREAQDTNWGISTGHAIVFFLQSLAYQADIVLDLHTANKAAEHVYVPSYAKESAKYFNMKNYLLIDNQFNGALDEAIFCPWWELVSVLAQQGYEINTVPVEAYTLEFGNHETINLALAGKQANNILNYLAYKGVIDDHATMTSLPYFCHIDNYHTLYAPFGGLYEFVIKPGEDIKRGEIICHCLTQGEIKPIFAPEDGRLILHFSSAIIPKGAELSKIMVKC